MECHCVLFMDETRWKQACVLKQMIVQTSKPHNNWNLNQIGLLKQVAFYSWIKQIGNERASYRSN
jgi:hypothetical protein